ncbi:MAG: hypothetical protein HKM89_10675 [Gemmatimonadales bacterium]|nr:hypothetical protein [Gemmatimonadales bacterium]
MSVVGFLLQAVLTSSVSVAMPAGYSPGVAPDTSQIRVQTDSSKREVLVTLGPFQLEDMSGMDHHAMPMDDGAGHDTPVYDFTWPIDGWFRGFRIEVVDGSGNPLPREIMHHMIMVNYDRRQLLYSAAERIMGAGSETGDAVLPKSVGVPVHAGMRLGVYVAWHNATGAPIDEAYLKIALLWSPKNLMPQPVSSLPIYMDVNLEVGGTNTFDVLPGRTEKSYEFSVPVSGRLLGISGHLHDYGVAVRLEDAETGKIITQVDGQRLPDGKVTGVERKLFGVLGRGLKLRADKRYRVVGIYDNPTGETIRLGAMAEIVGLYVPDDMAQWPEVDLNDPTFQRDLVSLAEMGREQAEMDHGAHEAHEEDAKPDAKEGHEEHEKKKEEHKH